jgi:cation diffusion facilitator family transporter
MAVTIGVNLFVSWYEAREGRRLKSAFLVADAAHTRADLYVSLGVVLSFAAALLGLGGADPLVALAIAAVIAWQAGRILLSAGMLTDRAVIPAEMLEPLAAAVPGVLRVHDARSRGRRDAVYVDLTVHLDGGMSLQQAHGVADRIEAELQKTHPEIVDVVVHLEPEGHEGAPPATT